MKCECNYHLGMGPNLKCPLHGKANEEALMAARQPVLNIETLYAWIDPTDGIVATISDVGLIPLVTSETRLLPEMRHRAELISKISGKPLELRVFQFSEVKDRVTP